ncbi:MAG: methyltransferase domain-containing protein [Bacteroidota bacterium]
MKVDFSKRSTQSEIMDDFSQDEKTLGAVFQDINRANRILGGNHITLKAIKKLVLVNPRESYTILDMGCGDGAMLREVALFFRKKKLKAKFTGIDLNENALNIARKLSTQFPEIQYMKKNILATDTRMLHCDILMTTLTLHHFRDREIVPIVGRFRKLARIGVIINDLERSPWAYYLFKAFSFIFIHSQIAKSDGSISILRGFKKKELLYFSKEIKDTQHTIRWQWAFRFVWILHVPELTHAHE